MHSPAGCFHNPEDVLIKRLVRVSHPGWKKNQMYSQFIRMFLMFSVRWTE
jgi:hypothetical protein